MLCLIFQCHKYSSLIFRQSSRFIAVIISRVWIGLCLLVYLWSMTQKIFYEQHTLFNFERKKHRLNVHFSVPENTFSSWWCAVEYTGSQQWTVTLCMCFYIIKCINHRWLYYLRQLLSVGLASIFMHCCSEDGSALFLPVEKTTYFQRRPISKGPFQSLTFFFCFLLESILETGRKIIASLTLKYLVHTHTKQHFHKFLGKSAGIFKKSTTEYSGTYVNEIFTCSKLSLHSMIDPQEGLSKVKASNWNTAHLTAFSFELQKIHVKNENLKW